MDFIFLITFFATTGYSIYKNFKSNQEIKSLREENNKLAEELYYLKDSQETVHNDLLYEIDTLNTENDKLKKDFQDITKEIEMFHAQKNQIIHDKIEEAKVPLYKQYRENLDTQDVYYKKELTEQEQYYIRIVKDKDVVINDLLKKNTELKGIRYNMEQFQKEMMEKLTKRTLTVIELETKLANEQQKNQETVLELEKLKNNDQKMYSTLEDFDSLTLLALPYVCWSITLIIYFGIYWWNYGPLLALDLQRNWREQFGFKKKD